jgi:hypothetical protein
VIPASCHDIELAIYALFTGADRVFAKVDLGRFPDVICPGLNVAVVSGKFETRPSGIIKEDLRITLLIAVKNTRLESERRALAHPLVRQVVRVLAGNDLGLDIDSIQPDAWDERTSAAQFAAGEAVFEVRFTSALLIPSGPITPEEEVALTSLIASYHNVNPATGQMDPNPMAQSNLDPRT